jgi:hypothetical protein
VHAQGPEACSARPESLSTLLLILTVPIVYLGWYLLDSSTNRGWHFGYYGQYNRTRSALASLPGVSITRGGFNPDISLEEFDFEVRFDGAREPLFQRRRSHSVDAA